MPAKLGAVAKPESSDAALLKAIAPSLDDADADKLVDALKAKAKALIARERKRRLEQVALAGLVTYLLLGD